MVRARPIPASQKLRFMIDLRDAPSASAISCLDAGGLYDLACSKPPMFTTPTIAGMAQKSKGVGLPRNPTLRSLERNTGFEPATFTGDLRLGKALPTCRPVEPSREPVSRRDGSVYSGSPLLRLGSSGAAAPRPATRGSPT